MPPVFQCVWATARRGLTTCCRYPYIYIQAITEQTSIIYGDGEQTRDFTFIKDVVRANILAAEGDACSVFNIRIGRSISINELAELIIKLMGADSKPMRQEPRTGDVRYSLADITRAKTFGYAPRHDLEEGLRETIKRFRNEI